MSLNLILPRPGRDDKLDFGRPLPVRMTLGLHINWVSSFLWPHHRVTAAGPAMRLRNEPVFKVHPIRFLTKALRQGLKPQQSVDRHSPQHGLSGQVFFFGESLSFIPLITLLFLWEPQSWRSIPGESMFSRKWRKLSWNARTSHAGSALVPTAPTTAARPSALCRPKCWVKRCNPSVHSPDNGAI